MKKTVLVLVLFMMNNYAYCGNGGGYFPPESTTESLEPTVQEIQVAYKKLSEIRSMIKAKFVEIDAIHARIDDLIQNYDMHVGCVLYESILRDVSHAQQNLSESHGDEVLVEKYTNEVSIYSSMKQKVENTRKLDSCHQLGN